MVAKTASGRAMMDNIYKYDKVNNILNLTNNAPVPTSSLMGGSSEYIYKYDDLYRLTDAAGSFKGSSHEHRYSLHMDYNTVGGIKSKQQTHERKAAEENEWKEQKKTTYSQSYEYGQEQPNNAPTHIGKQAYSYDKNANQTGWTHDVSGQRRNILWDEENRIRTIYDNGAAFHYTYDASGTRVIKGRSSGQAAYVNNEHKGGSGNMGNYTVYVNPYIVLRSGGYTRHFYIEGQRIVSKLGGGMADASKGQKAGSDKVNYPDKQEQSREGIVRNLKFLGHDGAILTAGKSGKVPPGQIISDGEGGGDKGGGKGGKEGENFQYYYHPDHLGSSSYITDASGEVYQHLEYFAFGETFVEEHSNTHRTPYLYNGKELDEETGLYYYGARYYDAQTSVWLAVDPLAEFYPGWNPYNYTMNNPINYIDPDGRSTEVVSTGEGTYKVVGGDLNDNDKGIYVVGEDGKRTGEKLGESLTMYSFYNEDEQDGAGQTGWVGTIDVNSTESRDLIENFKKEAGNISLLEYMPNATDGKKYDFKRNGNPNSSDRNDHHRGSLWGTKEDGTKIFGTARDAGNYAAGYIAGLNNLSWLEARIGFDGLEIAKSLSKGFFVTGEGRQSTLPQRLGHNEGYPIGHGRWVEQQIQKATNPWPSGPKY